MTECTLTQDLTPAPGAASVGKLQKWQVWIDRGGTFTDLVGLSPEGELQTLKLLSENPGQYEDAAIEGIRRLLGLRPDEGISAKRLAAVKMGTTVATNALLERRGEPLVLVTTRGYRDALRIAYQARPELFARQIQLPELLYQCVIEAEERVTASGEVLQALDLKDLRAQLLEAREAGLNSCAIVFMHGYRYQAHEKAAARLARELGFAQVSVSHEVSPLMKLVSRGDTTVVDAYLSPILRRYVDRVAAQMPGVPLYFMQSSGGLTEAGRFQGKDAILSGPAGGIVGMARTAQAAGHERVIGFDMGGTSTDVSHFAGEFERAFDTQVAGVRMRAPMMSIHTVAAGGGSIIRFDGTRLRVGPQSAGAYPGPASYGHGGPLTTTDANLMLGKLQPDEFPQVFGADGRQPLDLATVQRGFAAMAAEIAEATGQSMSAEQVAAGALQIAVASMANAIKRISVARGYDVTRYTLQCFGGAGAQHACLVADALGMAQIYIHPLAGVLSAYGMGLADQSAMREAALEQPLNAAGLAEARRVLAGLGDEALNELRGQGEGQPVLQQSLLLRYQGTDTALAIAMSEPGLDDTALLQRLQADFEAAYRRRFALLMPGCGLVIEAASVEAVLAGEALQRDRPLAAAVDAAAVLPPIRLYGENEQGEAGWQQASLYRYEALAAGAVVVGPALIAARNTSTVVEAGWTARLDAEGALTLHRHRPRQRRQALGTAVDPVMLEVFNKLFMNIAEQMGLRLQNTAYSVNIKERLDFSCALFDAEGQLIANAPHMPVHLGSMSESIRTVMQRNPAMQPGQVFLLNDPYHGGTHLPDVTVVTPVFLEGSARPDFYVASRGHHADIGGITPGSMPPFSRRIEEEGVLFDNFLLASEGRLNEAALRAQLLSGPWPARNVEQNIADLRAQIAANEKGQQELRAMVAQYGAATVAAYMRHVQDNAEASVRRVIGALQNGSYTLALDNGAQIQVAISVDQQQRSARIDFSGTSAQLDNNFNAPKSVTMAAVLYVFRTLVDDDIPLNAGCLKPLEVIVPEGSMLNPHAPAAVVAGNVETSSCVTNALYGALGVMAASQCTMNNFTFGDQELQYYETISGGSGAGPGFDGCDVVQTHMTNSRLTDPEVLEFRFPVLLEAYVIRPASGGQGRWRGGNGGLRRIRFLRAMSASLLSNGRSRGAFGLAGGQPGAPGESWIERADGRIEPLGHIASVEMGVGDVFVIATPGGGAYGSAGQSAADQGF
ncbi:hydantoinase B/oxoprolinase family protein [Paucibacter sp. APW11]|uniref:Hydantoinase B/oxoprolinase family protein n=1 Tax=Roseateles aquae TaxID=3077235 RepID=A0ABU3P867_9BURK|nr:hydantoinase B/oxoprolinase family protein [Paucibacter sp. APW11]MDT8998742.1 hydantoinase B/oxoprolinase family protein [Paucibacter sp. APW11]